MTTGITFKLDTLRGSRILIVDDSEDERMLLATYLQGQGCRIYLAKDGFDGMHKSLMIQPDVVLMDVRMPVCEGVTACRATHNDPRTHDIPVIFLSAAIMPGERVQGLLAGAVDYVSKPFDFEEVRLRLAVHLRERSVVELGLASSRGAAAEVSNLDSILFQSARLHLLGSLADTPDLQRLAWAVGTNRRRLNAAFRNCVGITVFEYLREERMKEARRLLANTQLEIQVIAMEVGYTSGANFATAFKDRFGISPSHFRQVRVVRGEA